MRVARWLLAGILSVAAGAALGVLLGATAGRAAPGDTKITPFPLR